MGDLYRAERRGRALSIFMAGLPAGIALSYLVSGRVAAAFSWRAAFFVAGLPGLLVGIGTVVFLGLGVIVLAGRWPLVQYAPAASAVLR